MFKHTICYLHFTKTSEKMTPVIRSIFLGTVFVFIFLCFRITQIYSEELTGKVVRVLDGETFIVLASGKEQVKVKLAEIDAPEKSQAFGNQRRSLCQIWYLENRFVSRRKLLTNTVL